jgi:hypothetical protein
VEDEVLAYALVKKLLKAEGVAESNKVPEQSRNSDGRDDPAARRGRAARGGLRFCAN